MRFRYSLAFVALLIMVACGGAATPSPMTGKPTVDITNQNVDVGAEIDALIAGAAKERSALGSTRVLVTPFRVTGPEAVKKAWAGEATAVLVTAQLSQATGVSVVDRGQIARVIDELKAGGDSVDGTKRAAASAGILGAQVLVTGDIIVTGADRLHGTIVAVKVATGIKGSAISFDYSLADRKPLESAVSSLGALLGNRAVSGVSARAITPQQLIEAAQASKLQNNGDLIAAFALFQHSLPADSDAWDLQADYLRLLVDLGMKDLARSRADTILARIPRDEPTACAQARIMTERLRSLVDFEVEGAREALRLAGRCGDPAVVQRAIYQYAVEVQVVSEPAAARALDRAIEMKASAWVTCLATYKRYQLADTEENDWRGPRADRYRAIADDCVKASNDRTATFAFEAMARSSFLPRDETEGNAKASATAKKVGGDTYDDAIIGEQDSDRRRGKVSEADAKLLAVIGARLEAIRALSGGLLDEELLLDTELLERVGIKQRLAGKRPAGEQGLVVKAHEVALSSALTSWASRTDLESRDQGDYYRAVADRLNPPRVLRRLKGDERMEQRLKNAKLPLAEIARATDPPLRTSSADVNEAFSAITDRYWQMRDEKAPVDKRDALVPSIAKLADWSGSPNRRLQSLVVQAAQAKARGSDGGAREAIAAAKQLTRTSAAMESWLLGWEADLFPDAPNAQLLSIARRQAEVSKEINLDTWVRAQHTAERAGWKFGAEPFTPHVDKMLELSADLAKKEAWQESALAAKLGAKLYNEASNQDGSKVDVDIHRERVVLLDKLRDPVRSLGARVELLGAIRSSMYQTYRNGSSAVLRTDKEAMDLVREVSDGLERLATAGRSRDAVRIGTQIPVVPLGWWSLPEKLLSWTNGFKDSVEFSALAGEAHALAANTASTVEDRRRHIEAARDLAVKRGSTGNATWQQRRLVAFAADETELWSELDRCLGFAGAVADDRHDCYLGLIVYIESRNADRLPHIENVARLRSVGADLVAMLPELDRSYAPVEQMHVRRQAAILAAQTHDMATFDRMLEQIRRYYTSTGERYQLATELDSVIDHLIEPERKARVVGLRNEFLSINGSTGFWIGTSGAGYADEARLAGDPVTERTYLELGRKSAMAAKTIWLANYDDYDAKGAIRKKQWSAAAASLAKGAEVISRSSSPNGVYAKTMASRRAIVLSLAGDPAAARRSLAGGIAHVDPDQSCADARVLKLAAALDMASGNCAAGEKARVDSRRAEAACREWTSKRPVAEQQQCDDQGVSCVGVAAASVVIENTCYSAAPITASLL